MMNRRTAVLALLVGTIAAPALAAHVTKELIPPVIVGGEATRTATVGGTRVTVGLMKKADYKLSNEWLTWTFPAGATHHLAVRFVDARTGKDLIKVPLDVIVTVAATKGITERKVLPWRQVRKTAMDMRSTAGHFCHGFRMADKGTYKITVAFRGKRNGTVTVTHMVPEVATPGPSPRK